jgi:hypothetical protein
MIPFLRSSPPPAARVVARIGLIADTHLPQRLSALPEAVFSALAGVDLILHAGDVGELRVLDSLSAIAPVLAVHGNDETEEAQRELPYQQLISVGGLRLLLTHAHYPDRAEEMAARRDDRWATKLERRAAMGRRAGAQIVVFGHTHIPFALTWGDTILVNPGGIASGNYFTRQLLRSVARLLIDADGGVWVEHCDLDRDSAPFTAALDLDAGFRAALDRVSAPIADAEVLALWPGLRAQLEPLALNADDRERVHSALQALALPYWDGAPGLISHAMLIDALRQHTDAALWAQIAPVLNAAE